MDNTTKLAAAMAGITLAGSQGEMVKEAGIKETLLKLLAKLAPNTTKAVPAYGKARTAYRAANPVGKPVAGWDAFAKGKGLSKELGEAGKAVGKGVGKDALRASPLALAGGAGYGLGKGSGREEGVAEGVAKAMEGFKTHAANLPFTERMKLIAGKG
jgi:hypothetical protein